jgi:hypothetical protein
MSGNFSKLSGGAFAKKVSCVKININLHSGWIYPSSTTFLKLHEGINYSLTSISHKEIEFNS